LTAEPASRNASHAACMETVLVSGWFTEGVDTAAWQEAKAL